MNTLNSNLKDSKSQGVEILFRIGRIEMLISCFGTKKDSWVIEQNLDLTQSISQTRLDKGKEPTQSQANLELANLILNNNNKLIEKALTFFKEPLKKNRHNNRLAFLKTAIKGRWKRKS